MPITRKIHEVRLGFDAAGNPAVLVTGIVTDTDEETSTGAARQMVAPAVINAAIALRDAVMQVAANAGKPLTF